MENISVMYIELVDNDTQEKVIVAVDAGNYDTVYEIILRRIQKQYDRQDYKSFQEYIEDVIEDLVCVIIEIETTVVIHWYKYVVGGNTMGTEKEKITHGTRIVQIESQREGKYLYTTTTDVGGYLVTSMYAEFDDNIGYEEEIEQHEFEILGEHSG